MVRAAQTSDISKIVVLMESLFGPNPKCAETFEKWLKDSNFGIFIYELSEEILGIATAYLSPSERSHLYKPFGDSAIEKIETGKTAVVLNLGVRKDHQGQGISLMLSSQLKSWLLDKEISGIAGVSWKHGGENNSQKIFNKLGFQILGSSKDYFQMQMNKTGASCSVCGPRCQCEAIFYYNEIK